MTLIVSNGAVTVVPSTVVIGSHHNREPAEHRVDGAYWARYPFVDGVLQSALTRKGKKIKYSTGVIQTHIRSPK